MKRLIVLVAALALIATSVAASAGLPRYKLKPGETLKQTIAAINRSVNRSEGYSNADCWFYDGHASIGWRHAACVGILNYAGIRYRFKMTRTPISCSRERVVLAVSGVKRQVTTVKWKHALLDCNR